MGTDIASVVKAGLCATPKKLPPWLFYDARGSELFEEITELPEYYVTRTEYAIFARHAAQIVASAGEELTVIELGAGTAFKTRLLLRALLETQATARYYPIDVSEAALQVARKGLQRAFPGKLAVVPVIGRYREALERLSHLPGRKLVMFIGSSIGNYEPDAGAELLRDVQRSLRPGDALLLGTDLEKPAELLQQAYDDAAGVTARFNKNLLTRINRELGGHFVLENFKHVAVWNPGLSRMEMHLESLCDQRVPIDLLELSVRFARGERLHTESSYKFNAARVDQMLRHAGFAREETFTDPRGWFGVHLARVPEQPWQTRTPVETSGAPA